LIDNALSPMVAQLLAANGFDAIHVRDVRMGDSADSEIFNFAAVHGRTIVSADTDFGTLLGTRQATAPSVVLLRGSVPRLPSAQAAMLAANLPALTVELQTGCIAVFSNGRIRIRALPIL